MNAEQFVYWLNGYLELSGAQELSAAQVKSVREHLALVLHKVTPPVPAPTTTPTAYRPSVFGGVQCGVCGNTTSNEGGLCYRCRLTTTLSAPGPEPTGYCDACGKERKNSELSSISTSNLAGVVMCDECRQPKRPAGLNILEAPIVDVPCVLTC